MFKDLIPTAFGVNFPASQFPNLFLRFGLLQLCHMNFRILVKIKYGDLCGIQACGLVVNDMSAKLGEQGSNPSRNNKH